MNERKTLFMAVGVLLVAMLASNFNAPLSGYATGESKTTISINPNPVERNSVIQVTVVPGPDGVKNEWIWIERNGERIQGTNKEVCRQQGTKVAVCYEPSTINYLVGTNPDTWPSDASYTVKVEENKEVRSEGGIRQNVYIREYFRIK